MGVALLIARWAWEIRDPISPDSFKGLFYIRDYLVGLPAAIFLMLAAIGARESRHGRLVELMQVAARRVASSRPWALRLTLALLTTVACLGIHHVVLSRCAHIRDEAGYLFQARLFADGKLWATPLRASHEFFRFDYVVDTPSRWFGSFFPGQSAVLAPAIWIGMPWIINPVLTGALVLVTAWAGQRLYSAPVGTLSAALAAASPFVLFQGSSYFSHIATAILVTVALVFAIRPPVAPRAAALACGLSTGCAALFRPLSGALVAIFVVALWVARRERAKGAWHRLAENTALFGLGVAPGLALLLMYDQALTGSIFTTPHHLALSGDSLSLGAHTIVNTAINIIGLSVDLLGVPLLSLRPLLAMWAASRKTPHRSDTDAVLAFSGVYAFGYGLYPYHGLSYGPRFYFECAPLLLVLSAGGILAMARWSPEQRDGFGHPERARFLVPLICGVGLLVTSCGILPFRMLTYHARGLYYDVRELVAERVSEPAVVVIAGADRDRMFPYMAGFQLMDPSEEPPPIAYVRELDGWEPALSEAFPGRSLYRLDLESRYIERVSRTDRDSRR